MSFPATADPARFDEAVTWFRRQMPVTESMQAELSDYAKQRAWSIAGVTQLNILLDVFRDIEHAIETGETLREFQRRVIPKLSKAWGKRDPHMVETIYRTNLQKAYNAGRWQQGRKLVRTRPFWQYDAILDGRTSDICTARDGVLLPHEHSFWVGNVPPLHHRCRSTVRFLTRGEAERRGGVRDLDPTAPGPDGTFGAPPVIDDENPVDMSKFDPVLRAEFDRKRQAKRERDTPKSADQHFADAPEFDGKDFARPPMEKVVEMAEQGEANFEKWTPAEREGLRKFSNGYDHTIRQAQLGKTDDELVKLTSDHIVETEGLPREEARRLAVEQVRESRVALRAIDRALAKSRPTTAIDTVYRGLGGVDGTTMAKILNSDVLTLRGQHSSSSYDPQVAGNFLGGNARGGAWNVMLKIKHKNGVFFEMVSDYDTEHEVLLPGDSRYRITKVTRLPAEYGELPGQGGFVIEAEEL